VQSAHFSCTTEFTSDSLELQREIQRRLMLPGALVVGVSQTDLDKAQIDSGTGCFFNGGHRGADCMPSTAVDARSTPTATVRER
jgi:hypothetical protein